MQPRPAALAWAAGSAGDGSMLHYVVTLVSCLLAAGTLALIAGMVIEEKQAVMRALRLGRTGPITDRPVLFPDADRSQPIARVSLRLAPLRAAA